MSGQDTYTLERTVEFPNMVARIFRPVLTKEEHNRRMKKIKKSSANLLKEVEMLKRNGKTI